MDGRKILFDVKESEKTVTVVALYAPNNDSPEFFQEVSSLLRHRQENKIIVGDFNLVLDVELDRKNTFCNNNKSKEEVENLIDEFCLIDLWRARNPQKKEYSWHKNGAIQKCSRIDFALVSGGLDQKVELIQYLSSIKTDHRAIYMVVDLENWTRGCGYWKLNTSLLTNKEFVQKINHEICQTIETSDKRIQGIDGN